jgi:hypothetical protein
MFLTEPLQLGYVPLVEKSARSIVHASTRLKLSRFLGMVARSFESHGHMSRKLLRSLSTVLQYKQQSLASTWHTCVETAGITERQSSPLQM